MIFLYGFFAWTFLEIATFIAAGSKFGFITTILLYVAAAALGGILVQAQGLSTLEKAKVSYDEGILPMDRMFDTLCLMAAGLLLILPGFVSDIIAFALLMPPVRVWLRQYFSKKYGVTEGSLNPDTGIIEGEYIRIVEEDSRITPPQG